jgi:hypothetical protein
MGCYNNASKKKFKSSLELKRKPYFFYAKLLVCWFLVMKFGKFYYLKIFLVFNKMEREIHVNKKKGGKRLGKVLALL